MVLSKSRKDTFVPNKKRRDTARYEDLHRYAQASLGTKHGANYEAAPPGDKREWLAVMADNFTSEAMILLEEIVTNYGICTPETCPCMSAGPNYKFLWGGSKKEKPREVPAIEYCGRTIDWVLDLLDDEAFFPQEPNNPFPKDFDKKIAKIYQRLVRLYAHWYRSHLGDFEKLGALAHLNSCFRHLYFFCIGNGIIDASSKDWDPLKTEIAVIIKGT